MQRRPLLLTPLAFCGLAQAQQPSREFLVLAIETKPEGASLYARETLRRAYERENISVRFDEVPLARSLAMSNDGQLDGEVYRIEGVEANYGNLVPVPFPIIQLQVRVYARKGAPVVQSLEDLQGQRVAVIRGVLFIERLFADHPALVRGANFQEIRRFVARDMADYAIAMELPGALPVRDELQRLPVVLTKVSLYHYLHKSHAALVPRLAAQLRALEAKGDLALLRRELIKY